MTVLVKRSALWMARAVRVGEISAVELIDAHAERIEQRNGAVNAVVQPRLDAAREEAQAADAARSRGEPLGPLSGVPFTVKEVFRVAGMPWTNGSRLYLDRVARADDALVARMRRAGAILLGKTNVSEFCAFWDSANRLYGATSNPHDPTRSAGGSSGGEAAALSAAMSPLGIGTDLTYSIRAPANWTGVYGLRTGHGTMPCPSHHPVPDTAGVRRFNAAGPMARSAEDLDLMLDVLAHRPGAARPVVRVAVFEEDGFQPVSRVCREAVRRVSAALSCLGLEVVDDAPPRPADLLEALDVILDYEIDPALARAAVGRQHEVSPYVAEAVRAGRAPTAPRDTYITAFKRIDEIAAQASRWFERYPLAVCPVTPDVAPPLGATTLPPADGDPLRPGRKLSLCAYGSALGLPALALPVFRSDAGLPVGVQLIGRRGDERTLTAVARQVRPMLGGWIDPD